MTALLLLLLSLTALAEVSGNLEAQARQSTNNALAQRDLGQDWNSEAFYLLYGNLTGKFDALHGRLDTNVFARYAHSNLFEKPYAAPLIFTFPQKLVARDLFNLQHLHQSSHSRNELVLNKVSYQGNLQNNRYTLGRMYINYGQGEIFNPINPFNQPTGLTSVSQVAQGNDGANFTYFASDRHTVDVYTLGDRLSQRTTLWVHGEYHATPDLQLDYVLGEDQRRDKIGGQVRSNPGESTVFLQALYQTKTLDQKPSQTLWDVVLGYDQQLTSKWHLRAEGGYQERNQFALLGTITDRFLPTEYFVALANQYEIHPLVKLGGTIINDVKSGFTYFITKNTLDLGHDTEAELFAYLPAAKGRHIQNPAQKLVTTDVGIAFRIFF